MAPKKGDTSSTISKKSISIKSSSVAKQTGKVIMATKQKVKSVKRKAQKILSPKSRTKKKKQNDFSAATCDNISSSSGSDSQSMVEKTKEKVSKRQTGATNSARDDDDHKELGQ